MCTNSLHIWAYSRDFRTAYLHNFAGLYVCGVCLYERYMNARKHDYSTLFSASIMSIFASARLESNATNQAKKRVKAQANT